MNIEKKYEDVSQYLDDTLDTNSVYVVFANYLLSILNETVKQSRYSIEDLLNYSYVQEYLRYNPRDEVLILAQIIHSLLFLYESSKEF